ncbi:ATP-binding cassette domain-containing protein [Micrococcales bacterium 31B]|nr:ATP-binding cassette domain-containing protein [Micrococcales bacterium 31B]
MSYTNSVIVLDGLDVSIGAGEFVAIVGASGSGKTTLMHCLSGLLVPTVNEFTVVVDGELVDFTKLTTDQIASWRLHHVGFVFQNAELVPEFTLRQNIALPLELTGVRRGALRARVNELIDRLGLAECADRKPHQVSGGQRQRAAVARAVAHKPSVVFADEPTGALDSKNSDTVLDTLIDATQHVDAALVVVTHDPIVAERAQRIIRLVDGRIESSAP